MLTSAILSIREGVEAALVLGIILSILAKSSRRGVFRWVWLGTLAAILTSIIVSVALTAARLELEGTAEKIFEGVSLLLAAALLTWLIFWMKSNSQNQNENIQLKLSRVETDLPIGWTLFWLAFIAVVREGIELALFLLAIGANQSPWQIWAGAVLGLALAAFLGWLWFRSTRNLSMRTFFSVTNILLIFFAAGLYSRAAGEFIELNWLPGVINPVYNISNILDSSKGVGSVLSSLFGYSSMPALTQTLVYLVSLAILFVLMIVGTRRKPVTSGQSMSG